ncbi:MAG: hypothetical protein ACLRZ9_12960 [Eubacterium sp.]
MADGTLEFDTKINDSSFEKGIDSLESSIRELRAAINELAADIKKAFASIHVDKSTSAVNREKEAVDKVTDSVEKKEEAVNQSATAVKRETEVMQRQEGVIDKLGDAWDRALDDSLAEIVIDGAKEMGKATGITGSFSNALNKLKGAFSIVNQKMAEFFTLEQGEEVQRIDIVDGEEIEHVETISSKMLSLREQIRKAEQELENANQELDAFANKQIPTNEYVEIQNQIDKTKAKLSSLEERQEKFLSTGGKESSSTYKKMQYDIEECRNIINSAEAEMNGLVSEGRAFTFGSENTEEMQRLSNNITNASNKLSILNQKMAETKVKESSIGEQSSKGTGKLSSAFSNAGAKIKSYISRLAEARKSERKSGKSADNYGKKMFNLTNMFKMAALHQAISSVINSVKTLAKEGIQNLAQYSGGVNKNISKLMSEMTRLKNSFATAFTPILNVVTPILSTLISYLSQAATAVGKFFAALTGQKTVVVATKVNEDYAKSLKDSSKSAKEASKSLASYDELEVMNDSKNQDNSYGIDPSDMFKTEEVESKYKDLANKVKTIFEDMFKPIKKAWNKYGSGVVAGIEKAFLGIKKLLTSIGKSFKEVWTNGTGERICGHILQILTNVFNTIGKIAEKFSEAWDKDGTGTAIVQLIADIIDGILEDINKMAKATSEWAETLDFTPLLTSIKTLLEAIQSLTDNIGDGLVFLYQNALLPLASFTIEDAIPAFLDTLASALGAVNSAIDAAKPGFQYLWDNVLTPIAEWTGGTILEVLGAIKDAFSDVEDSITEHSVQIKRALNIISKGVSLMWEGIKPILNQVKDVVKIVINYITGKIDALLDVIGGIADFLTGVFTGDWKLALQGILEIFAGFANGIITGFEAAINFAVSAINRLSFDVPDWVPKIGGNHFGFDLKPVELKKFEVPQLATGAIIPPRAPFMAMLGDQKSGTNIETPEALLRKIVREESAGELFDADKIQINVYVEQDSRGVFNMVKVETVKHEKSAEQKAFT